MKKYLMFLLIGIMFFPTFVFASEDDDFELVSEETKYYKTVENVDGQSTTYEISKEEYDAVEVDRSNPTTVGTTYKEMTSSIYASGSYYRYKNVLLWKIMPSTRSYDIIGIGFLQTVKVLNNATQFNQYYCYTDGSGCYYTYTNYPQIFSSGAGTSFQLPSGNINTLRETFYFDVEKNTTNTIYEQHAYSDYAHATSTISQTNSKKYSVVQSGGIILQNSISSYYDSITEADAKWNGTW